MRFSRVSIIGTLAAAALALLIIVPIWAADGIDEVRTTHDGNLTATVYEGATGTATAQSRLGPNVYVSNDATANYRVHLAVTVKGIGTGEVKVSSDSGTSIDLSHDDVFKVVAPKSAGSVAGDEIEALHGDTITIEAGGKTVRLTVDAEKPVISSITPAHRRLQSSNDVNIGFVVTDADSGLRRDSEEGGDATRDNDGQPAEPLSSGTIGASADINVIWQEGKPDVDANMESRGDRAWIELVRDHSYQGHITVGDLGAGTYKWRIEATDRAGNSRVTDSSSDTGPQDFSVVVDDVAPIVNKAFAGIGFNAAKNREEKDASSILLVFTGDGGADADALDASTIDAGDFTVDDNTVVSVIHPNESKAIDPERLETGDEVTVGTGSVLVGEEVTPGAAAASATELTIQRPAGTYLPATQTTIAVGDIISNLTSDLAKLDDTCDSNTGYDAILGTTVFSTPLNHPDDCIDTRNRVYLVLGTPLADEDTPEIKALGGSVRDRAGNANDTIGIDATDRITPTLTIDVDGDVETDGRPLAREEITVKIASGERLVAPPTVWLAMFDHTGKIVGTPEMETGSDDGTNAWEVTFEGTSDATEVAAVIIQGEDRQQNVTTTDGWKNKGTAGPDTETLNLADLEAAGLLVEFDDSIEDAGVTLNPSAGEAETDSFNPFIELKFGEGSENTVGGENSYEDDDGVVTKFDSYGRVELSDVTLDGEDVTDLVARTSSSAFDLALYGLTVGEHALEFTATDTAGNSTTQEYDFDVLPPSAYEVTLRPGWNLVSFPGDPVDTAIDSVLPADHPATDVLAYNAGVWTSAARGDGNVWEGDLTDIDGENAYWINTTSTRPLEAVLIQPGIGSASRPPSIQLIAGWNLIPVTDLHQADEETPQDNYFSSMEEEDFVVAYTYDARDRSWERHGKDATGIETGQGVWVFSRSNVILIP